MKRRTIKELASAFARAIRTHNERAREQWIQRLESPHQENALLRTLDQPLSTTVKTVVF
jgi:hypothetical protein